MKQSLFSVHEEKPLKLTKWIVTISSGQDDNFPHSYEIEASEMLSSYMFYQVIVAGLRLFGFK